MKLKMRYFGTVMLVAISVVCATGSGFAQIGVPCGADSEMTGPRFSAGATASLNILRENETDSAAEQEEPSAPPAPVELVIDQAPNSLKIGEEAPIFYTLRNASADAVIEWRSSNETVAVVDSEGKVRAISPGNVEITAAIGEAKSSALITVTEIAAESVKIEVEEFSPSDMLSSPHELTIGDKLHLTAKVEPKDAAVGAIRWKVEGGKAVTVDEDGLLTAKSEGTVSVTVAAGGATARMDFAVKDATGGFASVLPFAIIGVAVVAAAGLIVLLALLRKRKKEAERRAKDAAEKKKKETRKEEAEERESRLVEQGYARGYADSKNETIDRMTRVFSPSAESREIPPHDEKEGLDPYDADPDRPFSIDDIE